MKYQVFKKKQLWDRGFPSKTDLCKLCVWYFDRVYDVRVYIECMRRREWKHLPISGLPFFPLALLTALFLPWVGSWRLRRQSLCVRTEKGSLFGTASYVPRCPIDSNFMESDFRYKTSIDEWKFWRYYEVYVSSPRWPSLLALVGSCAGSVPVQKRICTVTDLARNLI